MEIIKKRAWVKMTILLAGVFLLSIISTRMVLQLMNKSLAIGKEISYGISGENVVGELLPGDELRQQFVMPVDQVKLMKIKVGTYQRNNYGILAFVLIDDESGKVVYEKDINTQEFKDNNYYDVVPDGKLEVIRGKLYSVVITINQSTSGSAVTVYYDGNSNSTFYRNHVIQKGELSLSIRGNYIKKDAAIYIFTAFLMLTFSVILMYIVLNSNKKLMNNILWFDKLIVVVLIFVLAVLISQGGDLNISILHAYEFLDCIKNGKILDFYKIATENALSGNYSNWGAGILYSANYNILMYFTLAVCLLPIKILEVIVQKSISIHYVIIYINIIIGFLLIYSGTLIHKLSVCFGADTEEAKIVKYIYLLSPITLFSTVGFGQMDIFGVIVMLWALIFYMNERMNTFSLLISVAIALKAFPLFIFIPLVLLIEKRLIYIIKYFVFGLSCPLVFKVVYGRDPVYVEMKKAFENFYGFTGRLFQSQIEGAHGAISLFMLLVFIVCFACYYHNVEKECLWKYVIIVPLVIYSGFSILIQWHPQYLIIYSVFLAQAFLISKEKNRFLVLEFFIGLGYLVITLLVCVKNVDNYMLNNGILGVAFHRYYDGVTIKELLDGLDFQYLQEAMMTMFAASILTILIVTLKEQKGLKKYVCQDESQFLRGYVYLRVLPLILFLVISIYLFYYVC